MATRTAALKATGKIVEVEGKRYLYWLRTASFFWYNIDRVLFYVPSDAAGKPDRAAKSPINWDAWRDEPGIFEWIGRLVFNTQEPVEKLKVPCPTCGHVK